MMNQRKGIAMFTDTKCKQSSAFNSACERFSAKYVLSEVARAAGIGEQMLRNKLNPEQPHQLTVADMISLYHVTGDETLIDGALMCCGLTAVALPKTDEEARLIERAINLNAAVGGIGSQALQIQKAGKVTKTQKNMLVEAATVAMGDLAIFVNEVELKFQTVPGLSSAVDVARVVTGL